MNENKKVIIVLGCVLAVILLIGCAYYLDVQKAKKIIKDFDTAYNGSDAKIVYLGRPNCGYCVQLKPILDQMTEQYDLDYVYVNTNDISDKQLSYVLNTLQFDETKFGTPSLAIVKDGKKLAEQLGSTDEAGLLAFLKKGGLVDESVQIKDDTPNLTKVDYSGYEDLLNGNEQFIVVLGQTYCSACVSAKPVLNEIALENSVAIHWLNLTDLNTDDVTSLKASLSYFDDHSISTPLMLVVKDKKVVDSQVGALDKDGYVAFLKKQGVIK